MTTRRRFLAYLAGLVAAPAVPKPPIAAPAELAPLPISTSIALTSIEQAARNFRAALVPANLRVPFFYTELAWHEEWDAARQSADERCTGCRPAPIELTIEYEGEPQLAELRGPVHIPPGWLP